MVETVWAASGPGNVRPWWTCCCCTGGELWGEIGLQSQVARVHSAEKGRQVQLRVKPSFNRVIIL